MLNNYPALAAMFGGGPQTGSAWQTPGQGRGYGPTMGWNAGGLPISFIDALIGARNVPQMPGAGAPQLGGALPPFNSGNSEPIQATVPSTDGQIVWGNPIQMPPVFPGTSGGKPEQPGGGYSWPGSRGHEGNPNWPEPGPGYAVSPGTGQALRPHVVPPPIDALPPKTNWFPHPNPPPTGGPMPPLYPGTSGGKPQQPGGTIVGGANPGMPKPPVFGRMNPGSTGYEPAPFKPMSSNGFGTSAAGFGGVSRKVY